MNYGYPDVFLPNHQMVRRPDYTNKGQLIHNNIGPSIIDEGITEYRLNIDSVDRDIKVYPDPFSFTVKFNPTAPSTYSKEEYIDSRNKSKGTKTVTTRFEGQPKPHINKEFKNVKYVKLENVILPQHSKLHRNKIGEYEFDKNNSLLSEMYVFLEIKELEEDNSKVYSTREEVAISNPFSLIIPEKVLGQNYYSGSHHYGNKFFKNSALGNLSQLTIKFYDYSGKLLKYNDLMTNDELESFETNNYEPFPITDLRHPLNKKIQNHISLVVGVMESQINLNTKYD
ncbi:MAG: hypothetical protein Barrevirus5_5 [Barrevirus sp.]|uniref:Uncharacterized protein n=1 Tax=Barrevirus sp. TaxID=2487763 RepID=A0A3G4ZPY1_9VIRU|nr:MAG: hypothetical protein Barrevirus5_5 [Barrevirus sp.]